MSILCIKYGLERRGQVAGRGAKEQAVKPGLRPDFLDSAHIAGHRDQALGHGFQQSIGQAFFAGGQHKNIGPAQKGIDIGLQAVPGDVIFQAKSGALRAQGGFLRPYAQDVAVKFVD